MLVLVADDDLDEIDVESTDNINNDVESLNIDDEEEGNLMIDDSRGSKAKGKSVSSSIYFSEKKTVKKTLRWKIQESQVQGQDQAEVHGLHVVGEGQQEQGFGAESWP